MTRIARLVAVLCLVSAAAPVRAEEPSKEDVEFFEKHIRPLLVEHCYECHSAKAKDVGGGLLLDHKKGWEEGGDLGPAIEPGEPDESLLIRAVRYAECDLQMPPSGKLPDEAIERLEEWVRRGAPDPRSEDPAEKPKEKSAAWDLESARQHWAFKPPVDPPLPAVKDTAWPQSPIDFFILADLEKHGLHPAPPADKRTLLRRATFDLTGLPPTREEMNDFLADKSPEAFARVVDRLLASPRYGERWGRHWLDVARYADSNGLDENVAHGNAWRYRDWVVGAFNRDLPFADFLVWQLAGDLVESGKRKAESGKPEESKSAQNTPSDVPLSAFRFPRSQERLTATGFLSLGPKVLAEPDKDKMKMDIVDEQIDTVGKAFLGLTLGCARCHDHKFDPIPTADYYALAGVFCSTETMESYKTIARWYEHPMPTPEEAERQKQHQQAVAAKKADIEAAVKAANEQLLSMLGQGAELPKDAESKYPDETKAKLKALRDEQATLEKNAPEISSAMGVKDGKVADVAVHIRGSHLNLGEVAPRRFPQVLAGAEQAPFPSDQSGRLQLAEWMADPRHPLTWRVFVNRLWRWRFGEGLVPSTDNFGLLGERPTNQPLLDFLAHRLIAGDGSVKAMHRLMMLSSTYQMSGAYDARAAGVDPANRLLWRYPPRRLEAEAVRDSLLFVAGSLDPKMGGSLLHVKNREFFFDHTSKDQTTYQYYQRSLYLPVVRNHVYDALELFDFPDPAVLSGDRSTTTVAPQALLLMNGEVAWEAAERLANRLLAADEADDRGRLNALYETALGRPAGDDEADRALSFVAHYEATYAQDAAGASDAKLRAWQSLCQAVLASNEFLYVQ
jgi:hypothetical protein